MELKTWNQKSGRHYLRCTMCWDAPSSSKRRRIMSLHSPVHSGHSSNTPWLLQLVSIHFLLLTISESKISQLCGAERNHFLILVRLEIRLYVERNSNSSAASVEMVMKLSLVPHSSRSVMIWSCSNSTYAPSGVNTCHIVKVIRP